jgi:hypothetical protein
MSSSRSKKEKRHIKKVWMFERKSCLSLVRQELAREITHQAYNIKFMIIITLT